MSDTLTRPDRSGAPVPPGTEDPRLARRRQQVLAAARRRRKRVIALVLALVGVVLGAALLTRSALLDVDRVSVGGARTVDRDRVVAAGGVVVGDPLVDIDTGRVRRKVMAIPGVASARVAVEWPDTVAVRITEERPLARLSVAGVSVVVARGGRVTGPTDATTDATTLPVLTADGVDGATLRPGATVPPVVGDALVVLEQMPAPLRRLLPTASLAVDGSLTFQVADDGGTVRFGPPEEVPAKVLAAETMLGGRVDRDCLDVLDLREPTRPTVSRRAGCVLAPPTVGATTTTVPRPGPTTTVPRTGAAAGRPAAKSQAGSAAGTPRSSPSTTVTGTAGRVATTPSTSAAAGGR